MYFRLAALLLLTPLGACRYDELVRSEGPEFAPGQVWLCEGEGSDDSVQLVIVGTERVARFGDLVAVQIADDPAHELLANGWDSGFADVLEHQLISVYEAGFLRQHTDRLVASLHKGLFTPWNFDRWASRGRHLAQPMLRQQPPVEWVHKRRAARAEFDVMEANLPAYLPKQPTPSAQGMPFDIRIESVGSGEARQVSYVVGDQRCDSLAALRDAVRTQRRKLGDTATAVIVPGEGTVFGDVAPVVDEVSSVGIDKIEFGRRDR